MTWRSSKRGNPCGRSGSKNVSLQGSVSALALEQERHKYVKADKQVDAHPGDLYELSKDCSIVRGEVDALEATKGGSVKAGTIAVFVKLDRVGERSGRAKKIWSLRQVFLVEGLMLVVYDSGIITKKIR